MDFLSLLFPKVCIGCGKAESYICQKCQERIERQWQICPECKKITPTGSVHPDCRTKLGLEGLISIYRYKGIVKKIVAKLKYQFASDLAIELANIATKDLGDIKYLGQPTLIPIPLSSQRKNWRGFNQSEKIGEIIAKKLSWKFENGLLLRVKKGRPQVGLSHQERARNICGEFAVNTENSASTKNKTRQIIVVFDDVWTTGSTIKEACKVLKESGFKKVWGMTIAR